VAVGVSEVGVEDGFGETPLTGTRVAVKGKTGGASCATDPWEAFFLPGGGGGIEWHLGDFLEEVEGASLETRVVENTPTWAWTGGKVVSVLDIWSGGGKTAEEEEEEEEIDFLVVTRELADWRLLGLSGGDARLGVMAAILLVALFVVVIFFVVVVGGGGGGVRVGVGAVDIAKIEEGGGGRRGFTC